MSYFVESFDPNARRALLQWARDDFDAYDAWAWAMSWLFDVCGEIESRGGRAPAECQYRPGAGGPDVSEDRAEGLALIGDDALQYAARVLYRYCDRLQKLQAAIDEAAAERD